VAKHQEFKAKSAAMFEQARKFLEDRMMREFLFEEEVKSTAALTEEGLVVLSDEMNEDSDNDAIERTSTEKPGNA